MPNRRRVSGARRVTLYLDAAVFSTLEQVAVRHDLSISDLVRRVLELAARQGLVHQAVGELAALRSAEAGRQQPPSLTLRRLERRVGKLEEVLRALEPQVRRLREEAPRLDRDNLVALVKVAELLRDRRRGAAVEYSVRLPSGEELRYSGPLDAVPERHAGLVREAADRLALFFARYESVRGEFFRKLYYDLLDLLERRLPPGLAEAARALEARALELLRFFDEYDPLLQAYKAASADAARRRAGAGAALGRGAAAVGAGW